MSANIRDKKFVWRGEQLTKAEYESRLSSVNFFDNNIILQLKGEYENLIKSVPRKFADVFKNLNCTGDTLSNSKNAKNTYYSYNVENMKNVIRSFDTKDCEDVYSSGASNQLLYDGVVAGHSSYNIKFFSYAHNTTDSEYINWCQGSSNCFGSVGLRNKSYCILNSQYEKEDFEKLRNQIQQDMVINPYVDSRGLVYKYGEFFPQEFSPFAYNE